MKTNLTRKEQIENWNMFHTCANCRCYSVERSYLGVNKRQACERLHKSVCYCGTCKNFKTVSHLEKIEAELIRSGYMVEPTDDEQ